MTIAPSRITLARLRAGVSKTQAAERLGATPRTIRNYETDGAPDHAATALARALGCRAEYFSRPEAGPLEEDRVFFRARRRTSAAQKHEATAAGRTGVELYAVITEYFGLPSVDVPELAHLDPVAAAQLIRTEWGLGVDPLPNSIQLAESKGIRVLSLPGATADVDAFSLWEEGRPYIFLSTAKSAERSRFDLAHELGHLVLHSGLTPSDEGERNAEREADQFASELLVPRIWLRSTVHREPTVDEILKLKTHCGVSAMALTYALHKAGILTDWNYRQACINLGKRGYKTGEPSGMARETSRVFSSVLPSLKKNHGIGTEELARTLGVHPPEIHGLTFGQALAGISRTDHGGEPAPGERPKLRVVQ